MKKFYIVTPCFNDFESLYKLLCDIDNELCEHPGYSLGIIIVNDASNKENNFIKEKSDFLNLTEIVQLNLLKNVGHQRAIATGLSYAEDTCDNFDGVIVMDSDGEDDYNDIFRMLDSLKDDKIIFAKRRRRSESIKFRFFYMLYKKVFSLLTGEKINGGNFSVIPKNTLKRVTALPEINTHYHASIIKSKLPVEFVICDRAKRYDGVSKMNFMSLILHGLKSVSVFSEIMCVRLTVFSIFMLLFSVFVSIVVLFSKFGLGTATPGWSTTVMGVALIISLQFLLTAVILTFTSISKTQYTSVNKDDYKTLIMSIESKGQ